MRSGGCRGMQAPCPENRRPEGRSFGPSSCELRRPASGSSAAVTHPGSLLFITTRPGLPGVSPVAVWWKWRFESIAAAAWCSWFAGRVGADRPTARPCVGAERAETLAAGPRAATARAPRAERPTARARSAAAVGISTPQKVWLIHLQAPRPLRVRWSRVWEVRGPSEGTEAFWPPAPASSPVRSAAVRWRWSSASHARAMRNDLGALTPGSDPAHDDSAPEPTERSP